MIRTTWLSLLPLLPAKARAWAVVLAIASLVAGLLEAVLLVLVVASALTIAEGTERLDLDVPLLGGLDLQPGSALLVAGVAGLVMLALHLQVARSTARLSASVLHAARERVVAAYAAASWARQAQDREGALQETVSTLSTQSSMQVVYVSNFVAGALGLIALLTAALFVDPLVTVVVLIFGTFLFLILRPVGRLTQGSSRAFVHHNSGFAEQMSQWTSMAMELRVFGVEQQEVARLGQQNAAASSALSRSRFIARAGVDLYRDLAVLFLVCAVAALHLVGSVDVAAVGSVVLLIVRSLSYAQLANSSLQSVTELSPNLEILLERLESLHAAAEVAGSTPLNAMGTISLVDVGYDYGPGRSGIDGVSIDIAEGEAVGVIGPSGGGKSTLVQVLLRLRPPTRGCLTASGIPYQEIAPECWHRLVALVPQEPRLFQGTVADNIAFFRRDISRERVERAAADAHVIEDVRRLPEGFDTELGPRGVGLSGGQKQRIAIARALLGDPQLLVLDEPTSALDGHSEQLLQSTIESLKGRVTLVIIAHRLTTLACCDRVIAMAGGRVKTIGSLDEALAQVSFDEEITVPAAVVGEPKA